MKKILATVIAAFCAVGLQAAEPDFQFRQYTTRDGLSSNTVRAVVQGREGIIWIGTEEGLNSFDGREFIFQGFAPQGRNVCVNALAVSRGGDIWIGTDDAVYKFDYDESFETGAAVTGILEDSDGVIWACTRGRGIIKYNGASKIVYEPGSDVEFICELSDRTVAACREDGAILAWSALADKMLEVEFDWPGGRRERVHRILEGSGSVVFLATEDHGLFRTDLNFSAPVPVPSGTGEGFTHVNSMMEYRPGELLVASDDGLLWINTVNGSKVLDRGRHFVYSVMRDMEGGIWTGAYFGGLGYSRPGGRRFRQINPEGDGECFVSAIAQGPSGTVWIGSNNCGVTQMDPDEGAVLRRFLPRNNILTLLNEPGALWAGSHSGGLDHIDTRAARTKHFLDRRSVYNILKAPDGSIWASTADRTYRSESGDGPFTEGIPQEAVVVCSASTPDSRLWFGTLGRGVKVYTPADGTSRTYMVQDGLPDAQVNSLTVTPEGAVWAGTKSGLCRYDDATDRFVAVPECGTANILFVTAGADGIWYDTADDLFRYSPADGSVKDLSGDDGSLILQHMAGAGLYALDGHLYLGTERGAVAYPARSIYTNGYVPPVLITRFHVHERTRQASEGSAEYIHMTGSGPKVLKHKQNNILITFAALSYSRPSRNRFAYMLEGFDKEWRITSGSRAEYTNLPGGNYTFRVKACNDDGVWNEQGASVSFAVRPHPLLSTPAMILYLLALGGVIVWIGSWLRKRVNKLSEEKYETFKKEYAEEEKARLEGDFVAKLKAYIAENLSDPELTAEALASEMCVSRSGLFAKVKEALGTTPHQMILEERLKEGDRLLREEGMSISEVSTAVGFSTPSYFSKCYAKRFGTSPKNVKGV